MNLTFKQTIAHLRPGYYFSRNIIVGCLVDPNQFSNLNKKVFIEVKGRSYSTNPTLKSLLTHRNLLVLNFLTKEHLKTIDKEL
jgi:hypothetical protein